MKPGHKLNSLTSRERQVLDLQNAGLTLREIAATLGLKSIHSIYTIYANMRSKLAMMKLQEEIKKDRELKTTLYQARHASHDKYCTVPTWKIN